ncbi:MAG: Fuc2NAc and GlcNAc transferase [Gammaproteobacteria bacterium]|jgi:Fuc2NAc and GlcNAc transferase|tara:strand:+ start:1547 stop:2524 length:978 start_codon:yes stop_codon:yes gene_type:complete
MVSVAKIMTIMTILPALITFIVGYMLIKYPVSISMPTDRGMHKNAIATSGGIALIIGFSIIFLPHAYGILLILIGFLGFLDDKYSLKKYLRFGIQILISVYLILDTHESFLHLHGFLFLFILIFISTYTINIYNFMDGIDQLAIIQAVFFVLSSMLLGFIFISIDLALVLIAFFLINYPRTRIFLGNSGSYMLGLYVAIIITKYMLFLGPISTIPLFILMTTFYIDTTYTIIVRFVAKFKDKNSSIISSISHITEAHRTHLYQKLAIKLNSHPKTVLLIMLYNIIWCLPLSYLAVNYSDLSLILLFLSYAPYTYYCYINKAGIES